MLPVVPLSSKLSGIVQTGDWLFIRGDGILSNLIRKFTFSRINHCALIYDNQYLFETDLDYHHSQFTPITEYEDHKVILVRPLFCGATGQDAVQRLCWKYKGYPYSIWDVISNGALFWLKDEIRIKALKLLSTKRFMKCDEQMVRVTYEATENKLVRDFEGGTPDYWLDVALQHPAEFKFIYSDF